MKLERRAENERILGAALALGPDERAAYLDEACRGDVTLRADVASLLGYASRADSLLDQPALEHAAHLLVSTQSALVAGQQIGRYIVRSPLGAGGMGEVYLGEDARLRRRIALKLLPASFSQNEERVRR